MAQDDYAILVGISRYADQSLHALDGPLNDVALMRSWLADPQGGNVPNITSIVSDEAVALPPGAMLPPVMDDFLNAFKQAVLNEDHSRVVRRPKGRLYLFFSGHGFCERNETSAQAALYVANCTRMLNFNICGTHYARWARDQDAFGEIVLVMDCCRDAELYKDALPAPFRRAAEPSRQSKLFEIYASARGGKAQERRIPERQNKVYGLLTHALKKALDHAAPNSQGVTTQDIKGFIHNNWDPLCGQQPAERPEIILPSSGEMEFGRAYAKDVEQRFRLVKAVSGASIEIRSGTQMRVVAIVEISESDASVTRTDQVNSVPAVSVPVVDGWISVFLPSMFCLAIVTLPLESFSQTFQVGASYVQL